MKRIVSLLIAIIFTMNTVIAYTTTTTIRAKGIGVKVSNGVGNVVTIKSKVTEISGWKVTSNNTQLVNNQYVMPNEDVQIDAVLEVVDIGPAPYTLTTIVGTGGTLDGVYTNYRCSVCGRTDHECEFINVIIDAADAEIIEAK